MNRETNVTPPATIVGSGLVGSLLAVYLAKRGVDVELVDWRSDSRNGTAEGGRSINLALSARGIAALAQVGLDSTVLRTAIAMRGRMIHAPDGQTTFLRYGKDDSESIHSISRAGLNRILLSAAGQAGAKLRFETRVDRYVPESNTLEVHDERTGLHQKLNSSLVFGTDGSASAIRKAIAAQVGASTKEEVLNYGYKELSIPPRPHAAADEFSKRFALDPHALHIWPRGNFMLIALPNYDGTFTCTLFLPFEGRDSFAELNTPLAVAEFFAKHFSDAVPLIENLEATFFANPTGHMVTVRSNPWNLGAQALLLGDAAHAIVPFFGQGMNCGFEDLSVFAKMLDSHPDSKLLWRDDNERQKLFSAFSEQRRPDANAIADLAIENFVEMRDKVSDPRFQLERKIEAALQQRFPGDYVSRYAMVSFSRVPYRRALELGKIQATILRELSENVADAESVDFERAGKLIDLELAPTMKMAEKERLQWI